MKRVLYILLLAVATMSQWSCSDDNEVAPLPTNFQVSAEKMLFLKSSSTQNLYIESSVKPEVSVADGATWLSVGAPVLNSDSKRIYVVALTAQDNTGFDSRTATLSVRAGASTASVAVTQSMADGIAALQSDFTVGSRGGELSVVVQSTGEYRIASTADWISRVEPSRAMTESTLVLHVDQNLGPERRGEVVLATVADPDVTLTLTITQQKYEAVHGETDETAIEAVKNIYAGWNIGNSLEATGGSETSWGNPAVSQELIDGVKAAGFNAVRIPCSWNQYLVADEPPYTIKSSWLNRVQEVVNYAYSQEMYVIINVHWDGGWLECNANAAAKESVIAKEKAIWTQIANQFADYGSRLIFAGNNEMRNKVGDNENWGMPNDEEIDAYNAYNQAFIEAVRATGGKNATRNLVVQSWCCNPWRLFDAFTIPEDAADNHLMVECHFYDPQSYTHHTDQDQYWGNRAGYTTSTDNQEDYVDMLFARLKGEFSDKGYPIILGEYGTVRHSSTDSKIMESEAYYLEYVTRAAKQAGMAPFYWDNGAGNGMFGLFNRSTGSVTSTHMLEGLMKGASEGAYPF